MPPSGTWIAFILKFASNLLILYRSSERQMFRIKVKEMNPTFYSGCTSPESLTIFGLTEQKGANAPEMLLAGHDVLAEAIMSSRSPGLCNAL
jgi:hypothetical protein